MGKFQDAKGNVRCVIDKLKGIKLELMRSQNDWQDWDFPQLANALKLWKDINPIRPSDDSKRKQPRASRHFQTRDYPIQTGGVCIVKVRPTNRMIVTD